MSLLARGPYWSAVTQLVRFDAPARPVVKGFREWRQQLSALLRECDYFAVRLDLVLVDGDHRQSASSPS